MTLHERFAEEGAVELEHDGQIRHALVEFELDEPTVVAMRWVKSSDERPQAMVLESDAPITIADTSASRLRVWADAAPEEVTINAPRGRLTVWNEWRDAGVTHGWLGNAHLRIEGSDPIVLTGVDGVGDIDGADLVVELRFEMPLDG